MTLDDRIEIQKCLNKGMTFKAIAQRIEKDPTTVSKEVKLHGKTYTNSFTATGKWDNGAERKQKLTAAGYDYNAVQKHVNELMK